MAKLNLTREHTTWMYDIVMDYSLQLQAATGYYEKEKQSLEALLKSAENGESAKEVAKLLEALDRDKTYVDIAIQRHAELKKLIEDFLGIQAPQHVETDIVNPGADIGTEGDEQVHTTNEDTQTTTQG